VITILPPLSSFGIGITGGLAVRNAVVATFQDPGATFPPSYYSASIDWGDGSTPSAGSIAQPLGTLTVYGSHTYAAAGHYVVVVTIQARDLRSTFTISTADVVALPAVPLTGSLSPASDSGASASDGITNIATPTFSGSSAPGATVQLYAARSSSGAKLAAQTVADQQGNWSITSNHLADGSYTFTATATAPDGTAAGPIVLRSGSGSGRIVIDTSGPRVTALSTVPSSGEVILTFRDKGAGLDSLTLEDAANYSVVLNGRILPIMSVFVVPGSSPTVVLTLRNGQALVRGSYRLRVASGGIFDLAGNALDGEFRGHFPSGNGHPGGDFVTTFRIGSVRVGHHVRRHRP
jgi:hypothetical protein